MRLLDVAPEAMVLSLLSKAAWIYSVSALKIHHNENHKQPAIMSNQGINVAFVCRALVYSCMLLGDLTEKVAQQPDLLDKIKVRCTCEQIRNKQKTG